MPVPVEVCLLSYDSSAVLAGAIASVVATMPPGALAIREHGPHPLDPAIVTAAQRAGWSVRIEHDPANPGFAAGCNALAAGSDADWLLLLNPDARVLAWPFGETPGDRAAIIGPERFVARRPTSHRGRTYRVRDEIARSWLRHDGAAPAGTGFVSGAALLVRRADLDAVGGFDEHYFLFYEDIDLCLRANDAGIGTELAAGWVVEHAGAHSTSGRFGQALQWSYESGCRFHRTHGHPVRGFRAYVVVDAGLRASAHLLRGNGGAARAYRALAARAGRDLLSRAD